MSGNPPADQVELQLCTLVERPFDNDDWLFEPKLDGLRMLVRGDRRDVQLISRNGKRQDTGFPAIVFELHEAPAEPVVLDGEIVCLDGLDPKRFTITTVEAPAPAGSGAP
jgi:bifunctional non-homologous end joining protein LigD